MLKTVPKTVQQAVLEAVSRAVGQAVTQAVKQAVKQAVAQAVTETVRRAVLEAVLVALRTGARPAAPAPTTGATSHGTSHSGLTSGLGATGTAALLPPCSAACPGSSCPVRTSVLRLPGNPRRRCCVSAIDAPGLTVARPAAAVRAGAESTQGAPTPPQQATGAKRR